MEIPDHHCLLVTQSEDRKIGEVPLLVLLFRNKVRNGALSHAKRTLCDHRRPSGRLPQAPKAFP
ncbi:hypothetical protein GCM10018792_31000 [Streptomyces rubradiris]|nr:hypothetical protein GCM10018792_31000 [Streptomyces rubradiris]